LNTTVEDVIDDGSESQTAPPNSGSATSDTTPDTEKKTPGGEY